MTEFEGFAEEDFAVFEVPGFAARMPLLRERVKPKLVQIGEAITGRLSEAVGEGLYPHVAQHLRRTVNAPVETWIAFAKEKRAYKPFVHLRVAVSEEKVRVVVFVEDDASEKSRFAGNLERSAAAFAAYLEHHPTIRAYDLNDSEGQPLRGSALTAETLAGFAQRMARVRKQHAAFGIQFNRAHHVLASGPEFLESIVEAARVLKPLYDCGTSDDFAYTYTPELVKI